MYADICIDAFAVSTSPSSLTFPSSSSESSPCYPSNAYYNVNRSTHLPFRRMSIPSAPNLLHRQSVVSMASFDSLQRSDSELAKCCNEKSFVNSKGYTHSFEKSRRHSRRKEVGPLDEAREAKRLKIIHEFHDTERAYVQGLDLIYSVCYEAIKQDL